MLKVDTQGHDLAVLRGCGDRLRAFRVVVLEASNRAIYEDIPQLMDYLSFMQSHGFELTGTFPIRRDGQHVIEFDCTFVRLDATR